MKRTNIYLAEGQAAALDRVAHAAGISRAELIRELIDRAIGGNPGADLIADLAAIDGGTKGPWQTGCQDQRVDGVDHSQGVPKMMTRRGRKFKPAD